MNANIFTIGHSTHSQERLVELLVMHSITAVCDVRSQPYSRFNPQFNRDLIDDLLNQHNIQYVFLGTELGARSPNPDCYEGGQVKYERLANTSEFQEGIQRIKRGSETYRVALMCAEKEPLECHRTILISRYLFDQGWDISHIHANGSIEGHDEAEHRLIMNLRIPSMFMSWQDRRAEAYRRQSELIAYSLPREDGESTKAAGGLLR